MRSLIIKIVIAQFLNTSVIYAILFLFGKWIHPLSKNGIVNIISRLVLVNCALNLLLEYFQPGLIYMRFKHERLTRSHSANMFQIQLNK